MPKPDFDTAAIKAVETLITNQVKHTPIDSLPLLKKRQDVFLLSFAELANINSIDRKDIIKIIGKNQDAITSATVKDGKMQYLTAYNQYLPFVIIQRAIARELGHIVLGHDGSRPPEVRTAEAECFARHLLCPRPLLKTIQEEGIPLTVELVGSLTGCRQRCMEGIRNTPGTHVPAELNRMLKEQFAPFVENFISYAAYAKVNDTSPLADFGTFFDGYEE